MARVERPDVRGQIPDIRFQRPECRKRRDGGQTGLLKSRTLAVFVGVGIGVGAFGPRSCRIPTSHISLDGACAPCADGLLQTCKPYSDSGKAAVHALVSGVGQSRDSTCRARMGLCSHMRNFRPAVDERSPATDTSVYSSALGSRVCGDEADEVLCLMHNA